MRSRLIRVESREKFFLTIKNGLNAAKNFFLSKRGLSHLIIIGLSIYLYIYVFIRLYIVVKYTYRLSGAVASGE